MKQYVERGLNSGIFLVFVGLVMALAVFLWETVAE